MTAPMAVIVDGARASGGPAGQLAGLADLAGRSDF